MKAETAKRKLSRKKRIRGKIRKVTDRPRLTVFRSHQMIYAQIIDDEKGETLVAASSQQLGEADRKLTKIEQAQKVGSLLAKRAIKKKIKQVVFDRGSYQYHGRIKALAETARQGGLKF